MGSAGGMLRSALSPLEAGVSCRPWAAPAPAGPFRRWNAGRAAGEPYASPPAAPPVVLRWRGARRGASVDPMSQRLLVVLAAAALSSSPAARAQPSVASLLPETTVLALHASPEGVDASTLASLLDDLDIERAADALRKLGALIEGAADLAEATEDGPLDELAAECPELADALETAGRAFGPTAVGVSVSRFDPVPDLVLASRPAHD